MEKTDAAYKSWIAEHIPAAAKEFTAEEMEIIAHTLVYSEKFEEYVHMLFKEGAIVISLDRPLSDEKILKHYGERGIRAYSKVVSDVNMPGYDLPLRLTNLKFTTVDDSAAAVPMPEGVQERLVKGAHELEEVQTEVVANGDKKVLYFAWKECPQRQFLYRVCRIARRHHLALGDVKFAYTDTMTCKPILIGSIEFVGESCKDACTMADFMEEFELMRTFKREDGLCPLVEAGTITGMQAHLLRAFTAFIEQNLTEVDASMYTRDSIIEAFAFHPELTVDFLAVFDAKFNPKTHDLEQYKKLKAAFEDKLAHLDTGRKKHDDRRRAIFSQALNITEYVLRTTYYQPGKLGIGFRVNPEYLAHVPGYDREKKFPEIPYGMYFVHGGTYTGMQVRFRDLARGGMRTIRINDEEHERYERPNMFTECYNLAFTQQKKNKDIPEGGSKSICFLMANTDLKKDIAIVRAEMKTAGKSDEEADKEAAKLEKDMALEYMYSNQRCFLTSFLKLIVWDFEKKAMKYNEGVVDYLQRPEYIYLGPDENFHDCMIEWLAQKSIDMGNFPKGAFISGKEEAGINHKSYGVTSWGVLQYLTNVLRFRHIGDDFTVKVCGGPDGDVAGNIMKLLGKYYPKSKLVTVTDGSGTCYDPEGFDYAEIAKMFDKVVMMHEYPFEKLHEGAWILCMRKTRQVSPLVKEVCRVTKKDGKVVEEWISSSLAFHIYGTNAHTTKTDVFLPCGGRPRSLTMLNVKDFFDAEGKPSSNIIVEGANLYTTQDAREYLEDRGVLIIKDSSANKCGVVSSSYEILGGLCLNKEQFIAIKPELAKNILTRLEVIANQEAKCMLDYYEAQHEKVRMSYVSELVSKRINQFTDEMNAYLQTVDLSAPENKKLLQVFIDYIPECIRKNHLEQALKGVPDMHKKCIISTFFACELVYNRGVAWVPTIPDVLPTLLK